MQNLTVFIFGILGNIVSFMVFLAPAATFYKIWKKKSSEGFQCVPYVVALLSCMLWMYYAMLQSNEILIITINSFGCFVETFYISIYIFYATKKDRATAVRLSVLLNFVGFGSVLFLTLFFLRGTLRIHVLGWINVALSATVYVAPLAIMKQVIQTKSVEFMPIHLSFALVFNAVMWFFYGLLLKDMYIAVPNTVGFVFGLLQIILYFIYRNCKVEEKKLPTSTIKLETTSNSDQIHPVGSLNPSQDNQTVAVAVQSGHCPNN